MFNCPSLSPFQGELLAFLKVQYNFRTADPVQLHRYTQEGSTIKLFRDHIYEQIASMTGLTRETVNRQLKSMEREGRIQLLKDYILLKDSNLVS